MRIGVALTTGGAALCSSGRVFRRPASNRFCRGAGSACDSATGTDPLPRCHASGRFTTPGTVSGGVGRSSGRTAFGSRRESSPRQRVGGGGGLPGALVTGGSSCFAGCQRVVLSPGSALRRPLSAGSCRCTCCGRISPTSPCPLPVDGSGSVVCSFACGADPRIVGASAARPNRRDSTNAACGTSVRPWCWFTLILWLSTSRQLLEGASLMRKLLRLLRWRLWCG
jgi:hypothetical protein